MFYSFYCNLRGFGENYTHWEDNNNLGRKGQERKFSKEKIEESLPKEQGVMLILGRYYYRFVV